jgi:hypothetical protein
LTVYTTNVSVSLTYAENGEETDACKKGVGFSMSCSYHMSILRIWLESLYLQVIQTLQIRLKTGPILKIFSISWMKMNMT